MTNDTPKLTVRQRAFAKAYVALGYNATKAAIECGYSPATAYSQGSRLVKHKRVQEEIKLLSRDYTIAVNAAPLKRTSCFLYLMRATNGLVKIGIAANPENRLSQINVASPVDIYLIDAFPDMFARASEAELHRLFADKHVKGEWFSLDEDDIAVIRRRYGRKQGS